MIKYVIIFIYIAINILLLVLNWSLFTQSNNLDFGFGVYYASPYILLQILGFLALVIFAIYDGFKDLKREIHISDLEKKIFQLQKDAEIKGMKQQIEDAEQQKNHKTIADEKSIEQ